ncbi:YbaB/EbfC family nucleoid-associated protein [Nonomuraea basaltis]|uniref:YbaB/EbfC family nucleoid-associated protein n=1 Tax=Nonomuraea basaltis TaxID=2495887 RepID=UPI00110C672B|nr:YbaB/EbfC family nucleoid-associated protein [Nonomuraea basaltis]TMR90415.1 YbaB/EbfC family nucleoid-associated protein [Nonomuraea basaltis]
MDDIKNILGFDPERLAKDSDTFFAQIRKVQENAIAVTARAESADQRVVVEYSSSEGVQALHIDARAMRMGSKELAETILTLIRQARQEAEAKGREQLTELLGKNNSLITERDEIGKQLRNSTGDLQQNLQTATDMLDRLRTMFRA